MTPEDKRCCGLAAAGKLERMGQTYLQLLAKLSTSMFAQRVSVLSAVFVVYGKSEIRTVNGINIETLLPPHASKYMVLSTPYHTKSSGPFCCLHNFNFCGTIPFPFCRVIVSSADAPSKRNERLYGRNDGVFVF